MKDKNVRQMTADIVAAYVGRNEVSTSSLPQLIESVYQALGSLAGAEAVTEEAPKPAVPLSKSVSRGHLVCLEDGKRFKALKRHLRVAHGLNPEDYRAKWNLPADHPIVAPAYSAQRAKIAKRIGLGRKPGAAPARRGRAATRGSARVKKAA